MIEGGMYGNISMVERQHGWRMDKGETAWLMMDKGETAWLADG